MGIVSPGCILGAAAVIKSIYLFQYNLKCFVIKKKMLATLRKIFEFYRDYLSQESLCLWLDPHNVNRL